MPELFHVIIASDVTSKPLLGDVELSEQPIMYRKAAMIIEIEETTNDYTFQVITHKDS